MTRGSPRAWGLGEVLISPHPENWPCYEKEFTLYNTKNRVYLTENTVCFY